MPRGLFVTGTDTGIGKTAVSAALLVCFRLLGRVRYVKPIQTGSGDDDDVATVRHLANARADELLDQGVRLPLPLSPHRAAAHAGVTLTIAGLVRPIEAHDAPDARWIVEGAGGVLVPIDSAGTLLADVMVRLALPVLVVARAGLGTINHTLLTLEALRRRALTPIGVVMVGDPDAGNRAAIEQFGGVPVVGEMPRFAPLTPAALQAWALQSLDRKGPLARALAGEMS